RWDVVLDAFARARDRDGIAARLVLFGDGPERAAMEARVAGRGDVKLAGFEKDRARLAAAGASADPLVPGCPHETYGLGIAEAMAAGVPVVVPDQGGATEAIVPGSSQAYASLDAEGCARAIASMLARDPAELRAAALDAARGVRSVDDHYADLLD